MILLIFFRSVELLQQITLSGITLSIQKMCLTKLNKVALD